jgi:hypothetical protein
VGLHAWAVASVGVLNVDGVEQQAMVFRFGTVVQGILTVGAESGCISKAVVDGACHVSVRPLTAPWPADHAVGPSPASESTAFGLLPDSAERDAGVVAGQPGVCVASGDSDSNGAAALILWHQQGMVAKDASPSVRWNGSMAAYPLYDTLEDAAAELFPGDVIAVLWWDGPDQATPTTEEGEHRGRRLRCSFGVFLDFSDHGRRINYHFATADMQGGTEVDCMLDDVTTGRTARIRRQCSRGAVLVTLAGSLIGLHDMQPGVHRAVRAGRWVTTDQRFDARTMSLESEDDLRRCWPSPVRESGVSVTALLADLGRHISKT